MSKIKYYGAKIIMWLYDGLRAIDLIADREYYTYKMRRNLKDNAWWWVLGFALGVMILLFFVSSIGWMWFGGVVTAIAVWLLLHLGGFC